jgi:hypothetical protein
MKANSSLSLKSLSSELKIPTQIHKKSKHNLSIPFSYRSIETLIKNLDCSGLEGLLKSSSDMQRILGWEKVPDHSTLHFQKLQEEQIKKLRSWVFSNLLVSYPVIQQDFKKILLLFTFPSEARR